MIPENRADWTDAEWEEFFANEAKRSQRITADIEIYSEEAAWLDGLVLTDKDGRTWIRNGAPEDNGNGYFVVGYYREEKGIDDHA